MEKSEYIMRPVFKNKIKTLVGLATLGLTLGAWSFTNNFQNKSQNISKTSSTSALLLKRHLQTQVNLLDSPEVLALFLYFVTFWKAQNPKLSKLSTLSQYYLALRFINEFLEATKEKDKSDLGINKENYSEMEMTIDKIKAALEEDDKLREEGKKLFEKYKNTLQRRKELLASFKK